MHDLPFQFIEYVGIRSVFEYLYLEIKLVSRNTVKSNLIKMNAREKARLKLNLETIHSRICLTSDLRASATTNEYICLTGQCIDKDFILQKRILNFCYMPPPYTSVELAERMYSLLCKWGIENKLFSLILDNENKLFSSTLENAFANDIFINMLITQLKLNRALIGNGDFFHISGCAYIINLVVQISLKDIDDMVHKIQESIKYVRGSHIRIIFFGIC